MLKVIFHQDHIDQLFKERFEHPSPVVQKRLEALYLKSQGIPHKKICETLRITNFSMARLVKIYQEGGVEGLKEIRYRTTKRELTQHQHTLEEYFRQNPPASVREACAKIKELTGLTRGETSVSKFLKSMGLSFRKTGLVPGKANPEMQEEFKKSLEPALMEAKEGKRHVFFVDASHFVWQGFIGFLWCFVKLWFGSPSGRQRYNVLGALNAVTKEVITVCNATYINFWSVIELLFELRKRYLSTGIPITIILDNAGYQACWLVRGAANMMGIHLLFLPPYSPNLNLIERLWKFVRKKALYNKTYNSFEDFCNQIQEILTKTHTLRFIGMN